jgi:hypothetical protein
MTDRLERLLKMRSELIKQELDLSTRIEILKQKLKPLIIDRKAIRMAILKIEDRINKMEKPNDR